MQVLAVFADFQTACDFVDQATTPENAGGLLIGYTAPAWTVYGITEQEDPAPLDTVTRQGQ